MHGSRKLYKLLISRHHRILANDRGLQSGVALQSSMCRNKRQAMPHGGSRNKKPNCR